MNKSSGILTRYGALELKRAYRKNLSIGIMLAALMSLMVMGGMLIMGCGKNAPLETSQVPIDIRLVHPPGPQPPQPNPPGPIEPKEIDLNSGPPLPTPDEEIKDDGPEVPSQQNLADMIQRRLIKSIDQFGDDPVLINDVDLPETNRDPGMFVHYDEAPVIVESVQPVYPEMARRAGLTGEVWVNVLVGKDGVVKDVQILKCSNKDVGFEEAATVAAFKNVWKPAISNGQAIAVWVSYQIVFKLQ